MTSRERMCKVLNHEIPDRVPTFEYAIDKKVVEGICPGGEFADVVEQLELDAITTWEPSGGGYDKSVKPRKPGEIFVDEWSVTREANTEMLPFPLEEEAPVKTLSDLKNLTIPDPYSEHRFTVLREYIDRFKGEKLINYTLFDMFETAKNLMGLQHFLISSCEDIELVKAVYNVVTDWIIEVSKKAVDIGADMIIIAGDIAYKSGTFITPKVISEVHVPCLKRAAEAIKNRRAYVFNHTHGNVYEVLTQLISTGIDVLHPFDPEAGMDVSVAHTIFKDDIVVAGNLSTDLLSRGTKEEIIKATKQLIDKTSGGGSYILMAASSIHSAVNPENYRAMVETVKSYGRYN